MTAPATLVARVVDEVTQPVDPDQPAVPEQPVVSPPSEPVTPVAPDEPAVPIDPTPDREVPEPAGPDVEPQPDPPLEGVRYTGLGAVRVRTPTLTAAGG